MNAPVVDLLIFEPSYRRLARDILAIAPGIRITLMNERAEFLADDKPIAIESVAATVAWPNLDVFAWEGRRDFFRALLKISTLRWVQSAFAGVDDPVFGRLAAKGVALTNSDSQAPAIADYVMGAALDFFQEGDERRRLQAASEWRRLNFRELADTTWLIVGYGRIGREVARRARAFGATLIGIRRDARADELTHEVANLERLADFLPRADVVILATGLNDATREIANADFFARMKEQSLLINVGRGGLVDEQALLAALDRGTPGRATLDVFQTEPLPPDHPLWRHPRVRLSSHTSALGSGNARRNDALFLDNLGRFVRGEPLRNVVKPIDLPLLPT